MARISGRLLSLKIDAVDFNDQASNASVNSAASDSDFLSLKAAKEGGNRDYTLALTVAQDLAVGTLWREIFDNVGDTVPFVLAPYGNEIASVAEPHVKGNAIISEPDGTFVGGESTTSTSGAHTVEVEWKCTGRFTLDTGV